jgi:parallel beta-helix repeat protein
MNGIIVSDPGTNFNEFIKLKIYGNSGSHGIYIWGANNLVEWCEVYNNGKYGIQLYDGGKGLVNNNIIRYNVIYNNGLITNSGGIIVGGDGSEIYNNIIYNDPYAGIRVQYSNVRNSEIYNNTIYNTGTYGIYIANNAIKTIVKNNIIYKAAITMQNNAGGQSTVSNNITTNPLFVDISSANFYLKPESPAIDAGVAISKVSYDFAKVLRPQGAGYDIGAYEYSSPFLSLSSPTNLRIVK